MPRRFDPEGLVRTLAEHEVECIFIGGWAAGLLGSPIPTTDVDITPKSSRENLTHLSAALGAMEAKVRTQGVEDGLAFSHDADSLAAVRVWNLTTMYGDFDISFVPSGTTGWDDLDTDALTVSVYGVTVRLASLADIIRSKQAANRPKDQRALPVLREILASRYRRSDPAPPDG
jgi:hypothetical protein